MDSLCLKIARKHSPARNARATRNRRRYVSFGSIKTATAIAGALVRLRDPRLLEKVRPFRNIFSQSTKNFPGTAYPCLREVVHHAASLWTLFIVRACAR